MLPLILSLIAAADAGAPPPGVEPTPASLVQLGPPAEQAKAVKELGPKFRVLWTDHFHVVSDVSPRYGQAVAGMLEQFYREVHPRFFKRDMPPLDVFLIDGGRDYEEFMRQRGLGEHASGYGVFVPERHAFFARRRFPNGDASGVGTLFHEAVHAFVAAELKRGGVPSWFNEGFAALFEQGRLVEGRWVYGNPNPWREKLFRPKFEAGQVPTLASYLSLTDEEFRGPDSGTYYNVGRSLCLYLLRQGEESLAHFVRLVLEGKDGATALETVCGKKLPEIEKAWRESVRTVNFGGAVFAERDGPDAVKRLEEGVARFPDYGMLHLALGDAYARADRMKEAVAQANLALQDSRLIDPRWAYSLIGWATWTSDPKASAAALGRAVHLQDWIEELQPSDFDNLAKQLDFLKDKAGAKRVRDALAAQQQLDQR